MKLYVFSSGDYDMEQWAVIADNLDEAKDLVMEKTGESFDYYSKNIREAMPKEVIKINNGD